MNKTKNIKVSLEFVDFLDKIKEIEKKRGREKTSYSDAGKILMMRIERAGGLKGYEE